MIVVTVVTVVTFVTLVTEVTVVTVLTVVTEVTKKLVSPKTFITKNFFPLLKKTFFFTKKNLLSQKT